MAQAVYKIVAHNEGSGVLHDGIVSGDYMTKEAAFESVVGPGSNAIKIGQRASNSTRRCWNSCRHLPTFVLPRTS